MIKTTVLLTACIICGLIIMATIEACSTSQPGYSAFGITPGPQKNERRSAIDKVAVMNTMSVKEHVEMFWKFFFEKGEKIPIESLPQQQLLMIKLLGDRGNCLKAAWLGHSSLFINIDGYRILTDPVFERKVTLAGPARFNRELVLNVHDLPSVDAVIISHDHYDHLNKFSVQQLIERTSVFLVPLRVGKRLEKWGVPPEKIVELNWWEETHPHKGLTIAATPARHFSGRGLFDRNRTLWASWVIRTENHNIFFSGDSGYFSGFKEIGEKYGPFDVTYLECGAYNEAWSNVHMFPEQTAQAFVDLKGKVLQPVHWAAFNLSLHPWYEPIERLTAEAWSRNIHVSTPMIGKVVNYEKTTGAELWWLPAMKKSMKSSSQPEMAADYSR